MKHPGALLSAFLDGEVTPEENTRLAEHLDSCEPCRRELESLTVARAALRSLIVLDPPPGLLPREDAPVVPLRPRAPVWAAAAAAAILALFVGIATLIAPPTTLEVRLNQLSEQYGARTSLDPGITPSKVVPVLDRLMGPIE